MNVNDLIKRLLKLAALLVIAALDLVPAVIPNTALHQQTKPVVLCDEIPPNLILHTNRTHYTAPKTPTKSLNPIRPNQNPLEFHRQRYPMSTKLGKSISFKLTVHVVYKSS